MALNPRIRVLTYLLLTFGFSSPFYVLCIRHGTKAYIFRLMWCPTIAGLVTTLLTKRPFREFGWRLGKPRYLLAGWSIPMAYSLPAYLLVWATGLGGFPNERGVAAFRSHLHMGSSPTWLLPIVVYVLGAIVAVLFSWLLPLPALIGR